MRCDIRPDAGPVRRLPYAVSPGCRRTGRLSGHRLRHWRQPVSAKTRLRHVAPVTGSFVPDVAGVPVLDVGHTFAGRYTIIRLLGAGGMAAVYQAWDETLRTAVALKLIRVDPSMQPTDIRQLEERFKRELKLARQVTHPNVIRIHDLGEVGRTLYITMAYVQGSDLATILQREGKLPDLARAIAGQTDRLGPRRRAPCRHRPSRSQAGEHHGRCRGSGAPHRLRYRPFDGAEQALRPDVGISMPDRFDAAHDARRDHGHARIHGARAGAGRAGRCPDRHLRIRADPLRAAVRRTAAHGQSGFAELLARIQQGPPPLPSAPDVPDTVEHIVTKCLKPDPAERYATCDELLADLEAGLQRQAHSHAEAHSALEGPDRAAVISAVLVTATWWCRQSVPPAARRRCRSSSSTSRIEPRRPRSTERWNRHSASRWKERRSSRRFPGATQQISSAI